MNRSTPAAAIVSTARTQSTPAVRCSTSSARASLAGRQRTARRGWRAAARRGSGNATPASTARIPSAASAISGEWAATETGSSIARLAPSSLASSSGGLDRRPLARRRRPGRASCGWRRRTPRRPPARSTSSGSRSSSRPMIAAIRPSRPAPEACISRAALADEPDRRRRARASPAATIALYWPIEWPASKAGCGAATVDGPALSQRREERDRRREQGRLGVLGPVEDSRPGRPRRAG